MRRRKSEPGDFVPTAAEAQTIKHKTVKNYMKGAFNMAKKLLAIFLVLLMTFVLMSTVAIAAAPSEGSTEAENADEISGFRYSIGNINYDRFVSWISDIFALIKEYSVEGLALVIINGISILFLNK